jgi:citrate synthase
MASEEGWSQPITKVEPNRVAVRGYRLESLMGRVTFSDAAFLVLRGDLPTAGQSRVWDAILVACVDHGATPPSTLAARLVASGGAALTAGIAAGILAINRHHGGAIEDCMRVLEDAVARCRRTGSDCATVARELVAEYRAARKRLPGYGHRVHTDDPRTRRLFELAEEEGLAGPYVQMASALRCAIAQEMGRDLPLNVDGAIAALLCEMAFPPAIGNGVFALARTAGLTAHVFDELTRQRPMRTISPTAHGYDGPPDREL